MPNSTGVVSATGPACASTATPAMPTTTPAARAGVMRSPNASAPITTAMRGVVALRMAL